jgi:hypothetical protein
LASTIIGKLTDQSSLASVDGEGIHAQQLRMKPKFTSIPDGLGSVGAFEERLTWHTSTKDAEAAEFLAPLNKGNPHPELTGNRSRRISCTSATDYQKIKSRIH